MNSWRKLNGYENMNIIGFLKITKSILIGAIIVGIAICCGLLVLLFVLDSIPRSGNQLFKKFLLDPIPKSVEVLDSYDGGADFHPDFCLHFIISPADFQLILASKTWKTVSEAPFGLECELGKPSWDFNFPPPALGSNVLTYTFIPRERDVEIMFANTQMNEVYYFYHDGNSR
jgi:hypothetical protein